MLNLAKPYQTRDGRDARAIADPLGTLHGYIIDFNGATVNTCWHADGQAIFARSPAGDLVNVPETRTIKVWINIYEGSDYDGVIWRSSREKANQMAMPGRIACIEREITYTVGEGL